MSAEQARGEEGLELGALLEDALFGMLRTWGVQLRFWAMFALWSALAFGPLFLHATPRPAIGLTLVWVYTLPLIPTLLAAVLARAVVRAMGGAAPAPRAPLARASALSAVVFGLLRLFSLFTCVLPALWITSTLGVLPAIMAVEGVGLSDAMSRALALSAGLRAQIAAALVVGLGALCGLELIAACVFWCVRALIIRQSPSAAQAVALSALFIAPLILWCGFEASLLAVIYHRRRGVVDRARLEEVFS